MIAMLFYTCILVSFTNYFYSVSQHHIIVRALGCIIDGQLIECMRHICDLYEDPLNVS